MVYDEASQRVHRSLSREQRLQRVRQIRDRLDASDKRFNFTINEGDDSDVEQREHDDEL